jgi:hypothetical protein
MKNIYLKIIVMLTVVFAASCSDDDSLSHTNVSAVNTLYAPVDGQFFNLGAQSSALFEWEASKAEDNGVVLYDVAFDTEEGDFSNPVYVIPSDGKGFQRRLNLPFTELNRIAGMAGIASETIGKLKWTVFASKGINVQKTDVFGTIEVERPGGFPIPDEVFITGTATETGDDLAAAYGMKKVGATSFEIYTSLSAGEYQFATRKSGTPELYHIEGTKLVEDGTTTYSGEDGVHRIRLDFSDGSVEVSKVSKIELWFAPDGAFLFEFDYTGNGTWEALNKLITFKEQSWGKDERYKFKFTLNDGSQDFEEWYGSTNPDNQRPTTDSPEAYWFMVPAPNDDWTNTYKFATEVDGSNVDIQIIYNSTVSDYTHKITIL